MLGPPLIRMGEPSGHCSAHFQGNSDLFRSFYRRSRIFVDRFIVSQRLHGRLSLSSSRLPYLAVDPVFARDPSRHHPMPATARTESRHTADRTPNFEAPSM